MDQENQTLNMVTEVEYKDSRWKIYLNDGEGHRGHIITFDTTNNMFTQHPMKIYSEPHKNWGKSKSPVNFSCELSEDESSQLITTLERGRASALEISDLDLYCFNSQYGFIDNPQFGLGVRRKYWRYFRTLEKTASIKNVLLSRTKIATHKKGATWVVSTNELDRTFHEIDKLKQRGEYAVTRVLDYKSENAIRKTLGKQPTKTLDTKTLDTKTVESQYIIEYTSNELSPEGQKQLLNKLADSVTSPTVRRRNIPKLREQLDLIEFDRLIKEMEIGLRRKHKEQYWHDIFNNNQFIL